jgi:hypothetical protein
MNTLYHLEAADIMGVRGLKTACCLSRSGTCPGARPCHRCHTPTRSCLDAVVSAAACSSAMADEVSFDRLETMGSLGLTQ